MNRRTEKRLEKSLLAYTDGDGSQLLGIISNISKNGIFIESDKILDVDSKISFVLAIYNDFYPVTGEVRWVRRPGDHSPGNTPAGMGIYLKETPMEFSNYVAYMRFQGSHAMHITH
ncbi:MAG: PilZ domain-containing protein [Candidatus Aminicenantes bacterium]|nr:PilZ domain-containing protein [Candidatus Aminicenantes bacterium]